MGDEDVDKPRGEVHLPEKTEQRGENGGETMGAGQADNVRIDTHGDADNLTDSTGLICAKCTKKKGPCECGCYRFVMEGDDIVCKDCKKPFLCECGSNYFEMPRR